MHIGIISDFCGVFKKKGRCNDFVIISYVAGRLVKSSYFKRRFMDILVNGTCLFCLFYNFGTGYNLAFERRL